MTKYDPERVRNVAYVLKQLEQTADRQFLPDHVQFQDKNDGEIRLVYTPEGSDDDE